METNQPIQNPTSSTPQPITPSPITQTPTPKKKIPWLLISFVVLLLGATGAFAYKYYELKQELDNQSPISLPSPQLVVTSPSPVVSSPADNDPTADWKMYNNGNYSYSLKYPSSWKTIPSITKGSKTESVGLHGAGLRGKTVFLSSYPQNPTMPFLQIETFTGETEESYNTRKQSRPDNQATLVDNFQAITSKRKSSPEPGTSFDKEGYTYFWFIFNDNLNNIYDITCSEDLSNLGLCEQILSTFKFTN